MKVGGRRSLKRTAMLEDTPMAKATGSSTSRRTKKSPNRKRVIRPSTPAGGLGSGPPRSSRRVDAEALHDHQRGADRDAEVDGAHRPLEGRGVLPPVLRREPEAVHESRAREGQDERAVDQAHRVARPGRQQRREEVHPQVGAVADGEAGDQEHRPDAGETGHLLAPGDAGQEGEIPRHRADEGRAQHDGDGHDDERRDDPVIPAAQHRSPFGSALVRGPVSPWSRP